MRKAFFRFFCLLAWSCTAFAAQVKVEWIAPTENIDGSPVDLAGFVIEYQRAPGAAIEIMTIADPLQREAIIESEDLGAVVIVAMRAVSADGQTSDLSNTVSLRPVTQPIMAAPRPPVVIDPTEIVPDPWPVVSPLAVDGHYFERAGLPTVWMMDTAWHLIGRSDAEIDEYLSDRASRGFIGIQGPILIRTPYVEGGTWPYGYDGSLAGLVRDHAGNSPLDSIQPVVINENYFRGVDRIVRRAGELGLLVVLPISWGNSISLFADIGNPENARELGEVIARRYRDATNVIWLVLGEYHKIAHVPGGSMTSNPTTQQMTFIRFLAQGVQAGAHPAQLISAHPDGWKSSGEDFHAEEWHTFDSIQSYAPSWPAVQKVRADRARIPAKPSLDLEGGYETSTPSSRWQVRLHAWLPMLAGAAGFTYGAHSVWNFAQDWRDKLALPGGADALRMAAYLRDKIPLQPAGNLVTNPGDIQSDTGTLAARTVGGDWLVYTSRGDTIKINRAAMAMPAWSAQWVDPRTGQTQPAGHYSTADQVHFDPPGAPGPGNDWILQITEKFMGAILDIQSVRVNNARNPGAMNLTERGSIDWAYWGRSAAADYDQKSGGAILNDYTVIGGGSQTFFTGDPTGQYACSWTDGAPTGTATSERDISFVDAGGVANRGMSLTTSALGAGRKRFFFATSGYQSDVTITASVSDASSSNAVSSHSITAGQVHAYGHELIVQVDDPSATLTIEIKMTDTNGNIQLQFVYVEEWPFELAVDDEFTDTNATNIAAHDPTLVDIVGSGYVVTGNASGNSDPSPGSMTIQSNTLEAAVSNEAASIPVGARDMWLEVDWVINSTSGHRAAFAVRRLDKENQYWLRLRQPENDWNLYSEIAGAQTSLASGSSIGLGTSRTLWVRVGIIDNLLAFEVNGERIGSAAAGGVLMGQRAGLGVTVLATTAKFDNLRVWRRITHDVTASESGSGAAVQQSIALLLASVAADSSGNDSRAADAIFRVTDSTPGTGADITAGAIAIGGNVAEGGGGGGAAGGVAAMPVTTAAAASGDVSATVAGRFFLAQSNGGQGADAPAAEIVGDLNVDVTTPATGGETSGGVLAGDLNVDVITGGAGDSTHQVIGSFRLFRTESAGAADLNIVTVAATVDVTTPGTAGLDAVGLPTVMVSVDTAGAGAVALTAVQAARLAVIEAAISAAITAALQQAQVSVATDAVGAAVVSATLDSDTFELVGDVYMRNLSVIYRIRSIRRR